VSGRWVTYSTALLAEAYRKAGQTDEGIAEVTKALATAQQTECRYYNAELHRIKGELLLTQTAADEQEAEVCFQNALKVSRSQSAKSLELRAAMSLSRLWQRQGKRAEAQNLLAGVYCWFTEGFDTADLKAAKAMLDELA
jgi:predicted ATPase